MATKKKIGNKKATGGKGRVNPNVAKAGFTKNVRKYSCGGKKAK